MKPNWFERKASAGAQHGGRDVQFKAQLIGARPEDVNEVELVIESADQTSPADTAG